MDSTNRIYCTANDALEDKVEDLLYAQLRYDERWIFEVLYYMTDLSHHFFRSVSGEGIDTQTNGIDSSTIMLRLDDRGVDIERTKGGAIEIWQSYGSGPMRFLGRKERWTVETVHVGNVHPSRKQARWENRYTPIPQSGPNSHFGE